MLHIVVAIVAAKQTGKFNIVMIPKRGGPPIAPALQHFQPFSRSIPFEHLQRGVKGNAPVEVECEGEEQFSESPHNGIMQIELEPVSN